MAEYMTVSRVNKIFEHVGNVPPLRLSMALMAGIDVSSPKEQEAAKQKQNEDNIAQFMSLVPKRES